MRHPHSHMSRQPHTTVALVRRGHPAMLLSCCFLNTASTERGPLFEFQQRPCALLMPTSVCCSCLCLCSWCASVTLLSHTSSLRLGRKAMGTSATSTGPVLLAGAQNMIPKSMALWSAEYMDWRSESFRSKAFWPSPILLSFYDCSLKSQLKHTRYLSDLHFFIWDFLTQ